jgi:hypothetical protein
MRAVLFLDAVTMRDPSGLKAAELTPASWSRRIAISLGVAASQMRAVLSHDFVTMRDPSGLKAAERDGKTARLYSYVTSGLFRQRLTSVENFADKVLDLDAAEKKDHEAVWKKRGRLVTALLESHGDLCADIERIIGTAED